MSYVKDILKGIETTLTVAKHLAELGQQISNLVQNVRGLGDRLVRVEERLDIHDLGELKKENQELRERLVRLETIIELTRADGATIRLSPPPVQKSAKRNPRPASES